MVLKNRNTDLQIAVVVVDKARTVTVEFVVTASSTVERIMLIE
jgi:hypothetical protein